MNIELGIFSDGNVIMVSDRPLPDIVKRIEYYREQDLISLIYDSQEIEDQLMDYEIPQDMASSIKASPEIMIFSTFPDHEPIGYKVPLVQIGNC